MPCLTDAGAEARRVEVVRVAIALRKPWLESTGPRTVAGKRAAAQNRLRHGADSVAFKAAMAYCAAVEDASGALVLICVAKGVTMESGNQNVSQE